MKTYRSAKVVLQDDEGDILILRRSDTHPTQALQMDLPGGIIEEGENPLGTVLRELQEETGIEYLPSDLHLVFAGAEKNYGMNAVRLVYAGKLRGKKPNIDLSCEHDSFEWLSMDAAIKSLNPKRYKSRALVYLRDNRVLQDV